MQSLNTTQKKQVRHIIGSFWNKIIKIENLLDDGDNDDWKSILMSILIALFLELVLCIYSFSSLKNWRMKSYWATINCSKMASFTPHILLTYKEFTFYNKKHTHIYIVYISQPIFLRIYFSLFATSYWGCFIRFQHLSSTFPIFWFCKMGLMTLAAQPLFILWQKLWKFDMKK